MIASRKSALCAAALSLGLAACGGHATSALPQAASGGGTLPNAHTVTAMHGRGAQADIDEVAPLQLVIAADGTGRFIFAHGRGRDRSVAPGTVPVPAFVLSCASERRGDDDDDRARCRFGHGHEDDGAYYYIRERAEQTPHRGGRVRRDDDDDAVTLFVTGPGTVQQTGIAFPAANAPLVLDAHTRYRFDLVRSNVPLATPTPNATPTPTPTPTPSAIGACLSYAGTAAAVASAPSPVPTAGTAASGFITTFTNGAAASAPAALACAPNGALDIAGSGNGAGSLSTFSLATQSFASLVSIGIGQPIARLSSTQLALDAAGNAYFTGAAPAGVGKAIANILELSPSGTVTAVGVTGRAYAYGTAANGAAYVVTPDSLGTATYDLVRLSNGVASAPVAFPAACTNLNTNSAFAADPRGNLWFSDATCGIVEYATASNSFSTFAASATANGANAIGTGPDGAIYLGNVDQLVRFDPITHALATLALPGITVDALAAGPNGDLYLAADADNQSASWIVRYNLATGAFIEYPGLAGVRSMVVGSDGKIYAAATSDTIERVDPALAGP